MKNYPTSWNGKPTERNNYTNNLFIIVECAGKTISYKDAAKQIKELKKCSLL